MIFIQLFFRFFIIGLCAFGGGQATIPFLKELSVETGWFTEIELANIIAVGESTPGAIGINMATYVGYTTIYAQFNNYFLGFIGGLVATLGLVAPSIIVILIVAQFLKKFKESKIVKWVFYGLKAGSIGLISYAAYEILAFSICNPNEALGELNNINSSMSFGEILGSCSNAIIELFDYKCLALALLLGVLIFKWKKHPVFYIALAAIIGIVFQF